MFPVKKTLANGKIKFFIRYRNQDGRLVYYPKFKYPDFYSEKDTREWIKTHRSEFKDIKKHADILRMIDTKKNSPDFHKLIEKFKATQKLEAPNSWQSSMLYLERFVLDFYLVEKAVYDTNQWYKYFEDFRDYLLHTATVMGKDKRLEFSTKNNCIRTLNKFLTVMQRHHVLTSSIPLKCRPFEKSKLNTKGFKDLFLPKDYLYLKNKLVDSKEFFILLYNTGMRFNELYSLPFSSVHTVDDLPSYLKDRFKQYKTKVYGYLTLDSQLEGKTRNQSLSKNSKSGVIYKRKSLKSCKNIEPKNRRIIPVFDRETWEIIKDNYNRVLIDYEKNKFGSHSDDYFLLDVEINVLRREFQKYSKNRSFHCCRHTFITNLVGIYRDLTLTTLITGHKSDSFNSYVHLYEQLAVEVSGKSNSSTFKKIA